jgi:hypothetical protein
MKIKLNNKEFKVTKSEDCILTISIEDDDLDFFIDWMKEMDSPAKKDYVRIVKYTKKQENGKLFNCYPLINDIETEVEIHYDYRKKSERLKMNFGSINQGNYTIIDPKKLAESRERISKAMKKASMEFRKKMGGNNIKG